MSGKKERWADSFATEQDGGWKENFLADEEPFDNRTLWRLGALGTGTIAAIVIAILAQQSASEWRRQPAGSPEMLAGQTRQIERITAETQAEFNRMALVIDQLTSDRDKLQARVSSVEAQSYTLRNSVAGLEVPGYIQAAVQMYQQSPTLNARPFVIAAAPEKPAPETTAVIAPVEAVAALPAPVVPAPAPVAAAPTPVPEPKQLTMASPPPEITGSIAQAAPPSLPVIPVNQTRFGIDLGGANSIDGLRALWRGLTKADPSLTELQPILMVRERANGLGMQLRLVAGPIDDAAEAARQCAVWIGRKRACETSVFDGQRLSLKSAIAKPAAAAPVPAQTPTVPLARKRTSDIAEPVVITAASVEAAISQAEAPIVPPKPSLASMLGLD